MSAPDLRVIDRAIERIRLGSSHFSCLALREAQYETGSQDWSIAHEYRSQYRSWAIRNGAYPEWWSSDRPYKRERMAALKSFRQACIDAASKQCNV